ncbi:PTS glucitol/sorbitol transporter subunit IIA [Aneurinibacillus terranovensis]|uniref:PTS glucitol/sorbitol transporter subunit IIA n=1 Tax=Aneurinibacillus terranovensis TaxID=278991 RepID=UPI0004150452|nr:PTS glucitol/sorbitol transporter subunit IIA [Aneurinibacillus terranovensis]
MKKSVVSQIGPMALEFEEEKVLIFFGPQAPEELKEVAVIHEIHEHHEKPISAGDTLMIDDQTYHIVKVGTEANKNLNELGHISIYFTEAPEDVLPGSIYATPHVYPKIVEGSQIEFLKK